MINDFSGGRGGRREKRQMIMKLNSEGGGANGIQKSCWGIAHVPYRPLAGSGHVSLLETDYIYLNNIIRLNQCCSDS